MSSLPCIRVKICCIASPDEAAMAVAAGASALGLVSAMPSGPGVIDDGMVAAVAAVVPPGVSSFLLTSRTEPAAIVRQVAAAGVDTVQLVDTVDPAVYASLRENLSYLRIVQVIHVTGEESVRAAVAAAEMVDAILLDSGNTKLPVKELGGTGRVHDWSVSRRIRESIDKPLYLAGGLTPDNVGSAIREVAPFGLDICSGVRTGGRLDPVKLERFFRAVRDCVSLDSDSR